LKTWLLEEHLPVHTSFGLSFGQQVCKYTRMKLT